MDNLVEKVKVDQKKVGRKIVKLTLTFTEVDNSALISINLSKPLDNVSKITVQSPTENGEEPLEETVIFTVLSNLRIICLVHL